MYVALKSMGVCVRHVTTSQTPSETQLPSFSCNSLFLLILRPSIELSDVGMYIVHIAGLTGPFCNNCCGIYEVSL